MSDLKDFLLGRAIAFCSGLRIPTRTPVAYLYNGVRLPALPEWDREAYPFAVIVTPTGGGNYQLRIKENEFFPHIFDDGSMGLLGYAHKGFELIDGTWVEKINTNTAYFVWSNHDIIREYSNADPDIFYASEPVPVYE